MFTRLPPAATNRVSIPRHRPRRWPFPTLRCRARSSMSSRHRRRVAGAPSRVSSCLEDHRQGLQPAQVWAGRHASSSHDTVRRLLGNREESLQRYRDLQATQVHAGAVMRSGPERQVRIGMAGDVERVRIGELPRVTVRGGRARGDHLTGRDRHPFKLKLLGSEAWTEQPKWTLVAQNFLDTIRSSSILARSLESWSR